MAAVIDDTPSHLRGNGRPVTEERTLSDLKVTGTIPSELDGRYVRAFRLRCEHGARLDGFAIQVNGTSTAL